MSKYIEKEKLAWFEKMVDETLEQVYEYLKQAKVDAENDPQMIKEVEEAVMNEFKKHLSDDLVGDISSDVLYEFESKIDEVEKDDKN